MLSAKNLLICFIGLHALINTAVAQVDKRYTLSSPNRQVAVHLDLTEGVRYQVAVNGKTVITSSRIDMETKEQGSLSDNLVVLSAETSVVNQTLYPEVRVKTAEIQDHYHQLALSFTNGFGIHFRAYDNGVAYQIVTQFPAPLTVVTEHADVSFAAGATALLAEEESFYSHNERSYVKRALATTPPNLLASLPALISVEGVNIVMTETALHDYAGMWLKSGNSDQLVATFPQLPTKTTAGVPPYNDRNQPVTERADVIAITQGTRAFPWRIFAIADKDTDLLTNQLSYQLALPSRIKDTSWIKPGKVAWDWYNANNLFGVDFEAGLNTETYKYYIDFAAQHGIEYVILDEGWYPLGNLLGSVEGFDVPAVMAYAKEKNVGIILWASWLTLSQQFEAAMDRFVALGAVGIKPDFFQRDDQEMVNFYWRIAEEAAKRKLLVDFHGAYKPAGLRRTFPNVLTREGVKGLEWNKWSAESTPEHNTIIPFIRMVAGPMDYTPGAMSNAQVVVGKENEPGDFAIRFSRPMSQTTRVHQMAMFTVYESPLQMMADSPSQYLKEPACTAFIAAVPTVWDETVPLAGVIGDYVAVARRANNTWFIGVLNDENARELTLPLHFLTEGKFKLTAFEDGVNAARWAEDFRTYEKNVGHNDTITIKLAPGGGYTARIVQWYE